jgi:hypothetical protein
MQNNQQEPEIIKDEKPETGITVHDQPMPVSAYNLPTEKQIAEYESFLKNYDAFVNRMLKDGIDYGTIPGVDKPTLLKPGAEKLEKFFFLRSQKSCVFKEVADDGSFIKYTYRTTVYNKSGQVVATCEGTCNSKEKKYRYTTVFDNQATPEQKKIGEKQERISKAGKKYTVYVIERKDFYDLENTIMKMAQKRSYVGAILEATNSSSRFTQDVEDVEDMDIQVDYYESAKTPAKAAAKEAGKVTTVFETAKKNLALLKDKATLEDYRKKIGKSDKYKDEEKVELLKIIDAQIAKTKTK